MEKINLSNKAVLVVDDSAFIRNMVRKVLETLGITKIHDAENGRQAFAALQTKNYDLIICDWHMPEMEGIDLLKAIRADERLKNIPFLMLTSDVNTANVKEAITAGVNDYLTKPFRNDLLVEKIARLL